MTHNVGIKMNSKKSIAFGILLGVAFCISILAVILVDGVLLTGTPHPNIDGKLVLVDLVVISEGLEALGDDLQPHDIPDGHHVDDGLALLIGLQLHVAPVSLALHGMKDNSGILDGLAIRVTHHGHFNTRRRRRHLEFAPAIDGFLLGASV